MGQPDMLVAAASARPSACGMHHASAEQASTGGRAGALTLEEPIRKVSEPVVEVAQ